MSDSELANALSRAEERDPALDPTLDHLSRRTLIGRMGAGTAGAIAAASFGCAQAQDSPKRALEDETLAKSETTFRSGEAEIKAFLATPKKEGKRGSVIVVHEIFGLNDHIRDVACRLAQAGFNALAPNLFTREGDPPDLSGGFGPVMQFVGKIPDKQIIADLKAASALLRKRDDSNKKVGIVGFCWGGRVSMIFDGNDPDLNAAVAYYGRISGAKSENQPMHPIDLAEKMKAPLLGHFGEKDTGIPPAEVEKLRAALKEHDKKSELYIYEGAPHAFNNDTRESYRAETAKLAWKRTIEWYQKYL
jgi:carboxymethylenebutenolidase